MSQSVQRAAAIVDAVAESGATVTELAVRFDVHRSTMFRELRSLEEVGYLRRTSRGTYVLGLKLIGLGRQAMESLDLRDVGSSYVSQLHATVGNTVHLAALTDSSIVYVDKREDASGVRMYSRIGKSVLPQCTGVGKAILAQLDGDARDALLRDVQWKRFTANTLTTRARLDAQLDDIKAQGWAVDDGEFEDFVNCVAVPVIGSSGVLGAISVTSIRMVEDLDHLKRHIPVMQQTAAKIAAAAG